MTETTQENCTMSAPPGNQFWKARSSHGRKPIFKNNEQLWDACLEYFEWVDNNPLYEQKVFHTSGVITTHEHPKMRAMTLMGLCNYLDISHETWLNYKKNDDFFGVITRAEQYIYQQKFEGAAADMLNSNIIARDLGLAEKKQNEETSKVKVIGVTTGWPETTKGYESLSGEELEAIIRAGKEPETPDEIKKQIKELESKLNEVHAEPQSKL